MAVLDIIELGHPTLLKKAKPVRDISAVQGLIDDMMDTLVRAEGVGLAAPQVNRSLQLFLVWPMPTKRYPHQPADGSLDVVINPTLSYVTPQDELGYEGCLSMPGLFARVKRAHRIHIQYTDRDGAVHNRDCDGFLARIFQHEYDHLQGTLIVDRAQKTRDLFSESEYMKRL